jgi:hypothetical protein
MNSRTKLVIGILVLLVIASMAGAVAAKKISGTGDVVLSGTTTKEETPNSVTIEKAVNIKVENGAKVKATEGGPLTGHSTDADQRLQVTLDSKISAEGKTSGTGTAVLNGSVKAQGWFDNTTDDSAVVNTSITSSVALNSGNKGTAEGGVCSSGTASATYNGTELQANVSGSSKASGKVQSASVGILNATGGITSQASNLLDYDPAANALIYANVYGENQASGGASASGNASASADTGNLTAYVTGSTNADGSGKGTGGFTSNAAIESGAVDPISETHVESQISSNSSVWSGTGKYSATASSSASTPVGQQNTAYLGVPLYETHENYANTTGTASSTAAICDSKGMAGSESSIYAVAAAPLENAMLGFGPEFAYLDFSFNPEFADASILQSDAWATGYDKNSKVSAAASTNGVANAALNFSADRGDNYQSIITSNTSALGKTSAKVDVKGFGETYADSQIASFDLIGAGDGTFSLDMIGPVEGCVTLPDPGLVDQSILLQPNPQLEFDLPSIEVLEISVISQSVYASGSDSGKKTASACADGETAADGQNTLTYSPEQGLSFITGTTGSSSASGKVEGGALAGTKSDHDPSSASVILGVSAQGIDKTQGLDATLIASTSGAASGNTWGTAAGNANAAGGFSPVSGPSSSSGTVSTSANANGGLGLSAAAIGSADYASDIGAEGDLVDVALIGTGGFAAGTAGAHAYADGQTEANGSVLHQLLDGDPTYLTVLNVTSAAFADGTACSDVQTKNGVALAADVLLAGEGTGAGGVESSGGGDGTAGSMVGQVAFAQQFGKSGSAIANTNANGEAGTSSTFYVDLGPGANGPMYITGSGTTDAAGKVSGSANAGCGDPLSASSIVAFTEFGGGGSVDPNFAGSGNAYDAALISSLSASWGKSADTWGAADGTAVSDSSLVVNTTPEDDSLYIWNSTSTADAKVKTTAATTSPDGFALGVAAQGASSEVNAGVDGENVTADEHAITLDGALSLADGTGKATADVNKEYKSKKVGKTTVVECVPIVNREATALSQFTADITDDGTPDINVTSTSFSGSSASTSADAAKGGSGFALAGEASGSFTDLVSDANGNGVPQADQDVFSVIADIAVAETDNLKETAKASGSADGDTNAFSFAAVPNWNGTQTSAADGNVSAWAVGGDKCKDPLSASLILSIGENSASPDSQYGGDPGVPLMDNHDMTLIASFSATNGSKGDTGASASGSANAAGVQVVPEYTDTLTIMSPTTEASTDASVWSHAAGVDGLALGVAGVGSSSDAHVDFNHENISDQNLMFSYAAGQGFGKKATIDASAGYDAADTAASASNVFDRDPDVAKVASNSSASGKGISTVQASDANLAKALNFGWVGQNASIDWTVPSANGSHADAATLFGAEVSATNDAKGTTAYTNMTKVNLSANASAGFADFSIPEESASVLVPDGYALAFLDPDGGPLQNGLFEIEISDPATFQTTGAYTQVGDNPFVDTSSNPNLVYWHAGAAADSDTNIPSFPPIFSIVPNLPPI